MSFFWKDLTFGVEIEFTFMTREKAASVISEFLETSYYSTVDSYDSYEIEDFLGRTWKVVRDGSIRAERKQGTNIVSVGERYKVELVSPILKYDGDMELLQDMIRAIRKAGGNANDSCGIHVHIGAEYFDANHLRILCNMIYSKQNILEKAIQVQDNRKRFCQLLSKDFIEELNKCRPKTLQKFADIYYGFDTERPGYGSFRNIKYHPKRYSILNLHNLLSGRMQTIEFRAFNSSLHAGVVKGYIQFCMLLSIHALNQGRASYKQKYTKNEKWTMRTWLVKIGMISDEFKTARHHLIKLLAGNSAWKDKVPEEIDF
jgi:hypothetical protein